MGAARCTLQLAQKHVEGAHDGRDVLEHATVLQEREEPALLLAQVLAQQENGAGQGRKGTAHGHTKEEVERPGQRESRKGHIEAPGLGKQ
eukprot:1952881-Heterocapsa_arctica.AAC.1